MKRLILIFILGIFLTLLVSSLDPQLPYCQGGDKELIICFGDEELTFLAGLAPTEVRGGPGDRPTEGEPPPVVGEPPEEPEEETLIEKISSILGIKKKNIIFLEITIIIFILLILLLLAKKRRKEKEEKT